MNNIVNTSKENLNKIKQMSLELSNKNNQLSKYISASKYRHIKNRIE